jgi:hypothetical protein
MAAEFRSVQTRMWREDEWFQGLPTDARLLFVYLFTNPSASVSGIYRLPLPTIIFESGIPEPRTRELLAQFAAVKKVFYADGVVWVVRMRENQMPGKISPQLITHLNQEVAKIPYCQLKLAYLKHYGYPMDTVSIPVLETFSTPDPVSIPSPTDTDTDTDTRNMKRDTDTETRKPFAATPPAPAPAVKVASVKPETQPAPKLPTLQQEMFGALAETCQLDGTIKAPAARLGKAASELLAANYKPEQVRAFTAWWLSDAWRAEHTPTPTLPQVVEKLKQSLAPPNRGNGKDHSPAVKESSMQAAIRMQMEINAEHERQRAGSPN